MLGRLGALGGATNITYLLNYLFKNLSNIITSIKVKTDVIAIVPPGALFI